MDRNKVRASGMSAADSEARLEAERLPEPHTEQLPEESPTWQSRTPRFTRMRFDWPTREERQVMDRARIGVNTRIVNEFRDAYFILNAIYDVIREPELDVNGNVKVDQFGMTVWAKTPTGFYIEDFTKLTRKQMEHFVGLITTRLFEWEQMAADLYAEALFAKAQFEERFAISFDAPLSGTVDDRRASANRDAAEERYFAIFETHLSRRADAIVRSMDRLSQRLKDILSA